MLQSAVLSVTVISNEAAFRGLRDQWNALAARVGPHSVTQGFAYVSAAWASRPDGDQQLAIVTVYRGADMVCIWPLYTRQAGGLTLATHVGCGADEYAGPLMLDDPAAADRALTEARRLADVLSVCAMTEGSPMSRALAAARGFKYVNRLRSPVVGLGGHATIEAWLSGKSRNFRQQLAKDRRKLAAEGDLRAERMSGAVDGPALARWLFKFKQAWLDERGIGASFAREAHPERLFADLLADPASCAVGLALKLDGQIVAGCVCLRSQGALEYYMPAFDPRFAAFSPGNLLLEDCVRLAIDEGLDFDFRLTQNPYKLRWADRFADYETVILACSWRGFNAPLKAHLSRAIRTARHTARLALNRLLRR